MTRPYAILRNLSVASTGEPFQAHGLGTGIEAVADLMAERVIQTEHLDPKNVIERAVARDVSAIAPVIPCSLIAPQVGASQQEAWGVKAVKADASSYTGADTVIAILDTGIARDHPSFQGITITEEDFTGSGNGDRQGHGTHCAGTIFGRDVNGTRIGVARGVTRALVGKVLRDDGRGNSDMVFSALLWALNPTSPIRALWRI
jgi:subtilisin family serine protease